MSINLDEIKKHPKAIARYIDHTNVCPNSTEQGIRRVCREAIRYNFYCVVVLPYYVKLARRLLKGTGIKTCTVIGFPFGVQLTEAKLQEMKKTVRYVDEFDIVMNRAAFKNRDYDFVLKELKKLVAFARKNRKLTKVIIETPELTESEIRKASRIVLDSGADFVKTAVGIKGPATVEHVKIIKSVVGDKIGIKASGGIRNFGQAFRFIEAGASRLGCSRSVDIIKSWKEFVCGRDSGKECGRPPKTPKTCHILEVEREVRG